MKSQQTRFQKTIVCIASLALTTVAIGCTKPKQTTAIGTGVGGAVGAGLGAIIGNQTGSTGGGIAIGAVTGAATGALISNAIQEQQEKTRTNEEALKRQERAALQSQRNELAELRAMKSDSAHDASSTSPRYRYRQPSVSLTSPEVSKKMEELQRRGPRPRNGSSSYVYQPSSPAPVRSASREPLARFDVRAEMAPKESTSVKARKEPEVATAKVVTEQPVKKVESVKPQEVEVIPPLVQPVVESEPVAKIASPAADSKECKEAMAEKELASQAPENSDKLFHLRRALRLCPGSAPLHFELGKVYAAMERATNAEEEYKQALTIDPAFTAAKTSLAELLKNETRF